MPGHEPGNDRLVTTVDLRNLTGVDAVLARARAGLRRLDPHETRAAVTAGALLIDTRTDAQRRQQGSLPGAIVIDRTVLEWRLDPESPHRIPEAARAEPQTAAPLVVS